MAFVGHSRTVPSFEPLMRPSPLAMNANVQISEELPYSVSTHCPLPTSHKRMEWSKLPDARSCPLGPNATLEITPECSIALRWAGRLATFFPVAESHISRTKMLP